MDAENLEPPSAHCPNCGSPMKADATRCLKCWEKVTAVVSTEQSSVSVEKGTESAIVPPSGPARDVAGQIVARYQDGYRVSDVVNGFGTVIKVIGGLLGGILALASLTQGGAVAVGGLLFGAILAAVFWIVGVVVSAHAQLIRAALDTAVNSSPFLSAEERIRAMRI